MFWLAVEQEKPQFTSVTANNHASVWNERQQNVHNVQHWCQTSTPNGLHLIWKCQSVQIIMEIFPIFFLLKPDLGSL